MFLSAVCIHSQDGKRPFLRWVFHQHGGDCEGHNLESLIAALSSELARLFSSCTGLGMK